MRRETSIGVLMIVGLCCAIAVAGPPARPLAVTDAQFDQLTQLETQADHAGVLDTQASYTSEREKQLEANLVANDISTGLYQFGWPGVFLLFALAGL